MDRNEAEEFANSFLNAEWAKKKFMDDWAKNEQKKRYTFDEVREMAMEKKKNDLIVKIKSKIDKVRNGLQYENYVKEFNKILEE